MNQRWVWIHRLDVHLGTYIASQPRKERYCHLNNPLHGGRRLPLQPNTNHRFWQDRGSWHTRKPEGSAGRRRCYVNIQGLIGNRQVSSAFGEQKVDTKNQCCFLRQQLHRDEPRDLEHAKNIK
jgi:hypothetical protein